jgi:hypothetical protein
MTPSHKAEARSGRRIQEVVAEAMGRVGGVRWQINGGGGGGARCRVRVRVCQRRGAAVRSFECRRILGERRWGDGGAASTTDGRRVVGSVKDEGERG